uniref:NADH-plastoquinone oxidoreductase subunit 4L n=1 Tax=Pedicularis cephalantha TaxID=1043521 RepID=UPI001EDCCACD|nr:NADH-plastoquinone oxidoreductase subunit 4L [Pedicularis cephalantha]UIX22131.1 NADH-plastoquinone oxidoreductase subunit 4L [Pedicularis cephalantha]
MMLEHILVLSAYLFSIGIYGLITSRNMVRALMCLELILNSVNINFVTFSDIFDNPQFRGRYFLHFCYSYCRRSGCYWTGYYFINLS